MVTIMLHVGYMFINMSGRVDDTDDNCKVSFEITEIWNAEITTDEICTLLLLWLYLLC